MGLSNINIRVDENDKKEFDYICKEIGLNMTSLLNMCIKAVIREHRIPFETKLNIPNNETKLAIEEARRIAKDPNVRSYKTVEECFEDILGEDY